MTFTQRLALGAVTGLAVALVTGCQSDDSVSSTSESSSRTSSGGTVDTASYTIDGTVRVISLDARAGRVQVRAKDGPVAVTERASYTDGKPRTSHELSGDIVRLRDEGCLKHADDDRCQVAWDISAPAGTTLELETNAGGIELTAMAGSIQVRTNTGGVIGKDLTSKQVDAHADAGGVELDFAEAPDDVLARATAGAVRVTVPEGVSYAVQAQTVAGARDIDVRQDPASPHKIRARTTAGGVEVSGR